MNFDLNKPKWALQCFSVEWVFTDPKSLMRFWSDFGSADNFLSLLQDFSVYDQFIGSPLIGFVIPLKTDSYQELFNFSVLFLFFIFL